MTRINLIPVEELTDQHLLAEHREIKRIPNAVINGKADFNNIPKEFTLGTGHVKFFYDKLMFLVDRYIFIYNECIKRGFNIENYGESFFNLPNELLNNYFPNEKAINLSRQRIQDKIKAKPGFYRMYGKVI